MIDPSPRDPAPFPAVSHEEWRARVEEELGDRDFARTLVHRRPDGIEVQPLYSPSPADVPDGAGFPGTPPYVRGFAPAGRSAGWEIVAAGEEPTLGDPLGDLARQGAVEGGLEDALHGLAAAPAIGVSILPYHDAGATAAQELGIALATTVEYLRRLEAGGIDLARGAERFTFRVAMGADVFGGMAKLRALRGLWARLVSACGLADVPPARIHAVTSARTLSRRDPWTNILRVTTQTFAAICGGADAITAAPFDAALGEPGALGRRLAENTQHILAEESHVGRVVDPAGGSWYVEALTDALARAAWNELRSLEEAGGMARALLDGEVRRRLDASWEARRAHLATRRRPVTGVSEFADTDHLLVREARPAPSPGGERVIDPLPRRRDAAPFEQLRDAADHLAPPPTVHLATLGPGSEHNARAIFARNLFQAGGFRVLQEDDAVPLGELVESIAAAKTPVACLCGADQRYVEEVPAAARALREAGVATVLVAGRPGPHEEAWRAAGVDDFLYAGMDVLGFLGRLLAAGEAR